jgi:hypothetical protein
MSDESIRARLEWALAKRLPEDDDDWGCVESPYGLQPEAFSPWGDVIQGIFGNYAEDADDLMIAALEAAQNGTQWAFTGKHGFAGEFALYVLAGHGLIDYGSSPRGGFPAHEVADLFPTLIEKWKAYKQIVWSET